MSQVTATLQVAQNGIDLLNQSGFQQLADVAMGQELVGATAVVRPFHIGRSTISYLIAQLATTPAISNSRLVEMRDKLKEHFNDDDLKDLCFDLGIAHESLGGEGRAARARQLVDYARRTGRLADLVAYCRKKRQHVTWPDFPEASGAQSAIVDKQDIGMVISLAQPALSLAAAFLAQEKVDANFILMTNVPAYNETRFLNVGEDWVEITQSFHKTMHNVRVKFPQSRCHFFFAAPVPLAFLMGCALGTVYQGDRVYHLHRDENNQSYYIPVATVSRLLRGEQAPASS